MQVIVINLFSAIDRRQFQEKQLQSLSLNYEFLEATSVKDIDDTTYQRVHEDWLRPLRRSEVACYYSHRRCWERVIKSNKPILILEDDALLSKDVPSLLNKIESLSGVDAIDLEVTGRKKNVSRSKETLLDKRNILRVYINSAGAGGYVLFPSGAKKLLEKEKRKGISLADAHIASCYTLKAYQVEPAAIVQFILCPFYGIDNPEYKKFYTSETNAENKYCQQRWFFRVRRFWNELKQGLLKIKLSTVSKRRFIQLDKNDFRK